MAEEKFNSIRGFETQLEIKFGELRSSSALHEDCDVYNLGVQIFREHYSEQSLRYFWDIVCGARCGHETPASSSRVSPGIERNFEAREVLRSIMKGPSSSDCPKTAQRLIIEDDGNPYTTFFG
jgi:hypothetical protein